MDPGSIAALVTASATAASVLIAVLLLRTTLAAHNLTGFQYLLGEAYVDRRFDQPLVVNDRPCLLLRDVRALVHEERRNAREPLAAWLTEFHDRTIPLGSWENRFAYELSVVLQRLADLVMTGAIPLNVVLRTHSLQIVEDWSYCRGLIERNIRGPKAAYQVVDGLQIPFHRRHAQWLANIAAIYLLSEWSPGTRELVEVGFGQPEAVIHRWERALRQAEGSLMPFRARFAAWKVLDKAGR